MTRPIFIKNYCTTSRAVSPGNVSKNNETQEPSPRFNEDVLGKYEMFDFTEEELKTIKNTASKDDFDTIYSAIPEVLNDRAGVGFTTSGHTGIDVLVYTYGPKNNVFSGLIENTDIANEVFGFLT